MPHGFSQVVRRRWLVHFEARRRRRRRRQSKSVSGCVVAVGSSKCTNEGQLATGDDGGMCHDFHSSMHEGTLYSLVNRCQSLTQSARHLIPPECGFVCGVLPTAKSFAVWGSKHNSTLKMDFGVGDVCNQRSPFIH